MQPDGTVHNCRRPHHPTYPPADPEGGSWRCGAVQTVEPEIDAYEKKCSPNVEANGVHMLYGWQLWAWPLVLVEAELHAVRLSPEGQMVDLTPKPHHETTVLFVTGAR